MTVAFGALLEAFGLKRADEEDLDAPLRVRVSKQTIADLNALEAFLQGHGFREATRSALIRAALSSYLDGVRSEAPEALIPPAAQQPNTR